MNRECIACGHWQHEDQFVPGEDWCLMCDEPESFDQRVIARWKAMEKPGDPPPFVQRSFDRENAQILRTELRGRSSGKARVGQWTGRGVHRTGWISLT